MENPSFWDNIDRLCETHDVVIDRPMGSGHPRYPAWIYPVDYGYLAGTAAADGEEQDIWLGSLPDKKCTGLLCTAVWEKGDMEIKLLLGCTPAEIELILAFFNNSQGIRAIYVPREN